MKNGITILLHHRDVYPDRSHHLIWPIAAAWEGMGLEVSIVKGIPDKFDENTLLLPHIDLTWVPEDYQRFISSAPHVLNLALNDVSKRKISRNLVTRTEFFDGPVIVKTDANCGGYPDFLNSSFPTRLSLRFNEWLRPSKVQRMKSGKYKVYEHKDDVPASVWQNENLVVEKFIPERDGPFYFFRNVFFLGDVVLNNRAWSKSRVIKGAVIEGSEPVEISPEIHTIREQMGFHYGKFDYVVHDGKVHILDANKTPGVLGIPKIDNGLGRALAKGIHQYL